MEQSALPLSGRLVEAVITNVCRKPIQGDDSWEDCSVGVAPNSIVATDSQSAVIIGEPADIHVATQRKEALIECFIARQYGNPVRLDAIDRNTDPATGEARPMPHIQKVIQQNMARMKPLASVNPLALIAIGKIASAAGAHTVELYLPDSKDPSVLGYQFHFAPDPDHINLFNEWEGEIPARGIFVVRASAKSHGFDEAEEEETEAQAPVRERKKKEPVKLEVVEASEAPEPEPIVTIDRDEQITRGSYQLPALCVLESRPETSAVSGEYESEIMNVLRASNIPGRMLGHSAGPTVTMYELYTPAGLPVKRVAALADDLQMQLAVKSVRIQAPIPGKQAIGIEIPNKVPRIVGLDEICATDAFVNHERRLMMALGLDISGKPVYADLASMPHLLIAGATNSGKSIGLATALCSLLLRNTPRDLRMILIDPKQVELSLFEDIPHLACPVVTDMLQVPGVLRAVEREMEHRYDLLKKAKVRNIDGYNDAAHEDDRLSYWVVVIDELADLMMGAKDMIEPLIVKLAQKARAVGIHLITATQRPSVDVITGLIKANMPSRIAYAVASGVDSQVILDQRGAEKLLGRGDMLFAPIDGGGKTTRLQGAYVSESEVERICGYWRGVEDQRYENVPVEDETEAAS